MSLFEKLIDERAKSNKEATASSSKIKAVMAENSQIIKTIWEYALLKDIVNDDGVRSYFTIWYTGKDGKPGCLHIERKKDVLSWELSVDEWTLSEESECFEINDALTYLTE